MTVRGIPKEERYVYVCHRTRHPIRIDGRLNEATWGKTNEVGPFQLYDGTETAQLRTQAKMIWDEKKLYVAFVCEDPDIWATVRERDQDLYEEEVVEVFIDADGDGKTYVEIEVNPLGTLFDA